MATTTRSRSSDTRTRKRKTTRKKVPKRQADRLEPASQKPARRKTKTRKKRTKAKRKKVSRQRKPDEMSLEAWQRELRRQYGREQNFQLENVGEHPFFSEFHVTNPQSGGTYRVAVRGQRPGENFCSCPDFATNDLGTCKHIEFTLAKLERKRGGKKAFREGFHPPYSEVFLQYGARRVVRFRPGEECPTELARLAADYFDDEGQLQPDAFGRFQEFLSAASDIDHELRCYDDALSFVAQVRDDEFRRARLKRAFPQGVRSSTFKHLLKVPLYDYQREGALFAAQAGRVLIGDEMGLGKTIQALAAAEIMAREFGVERVLIVCPTSLKHQWEREIERFTQRSVQVIGGPPGERRRQYQSDAFYKITNYDTVYRDLALIQHLSADLVILDEAQRIKNWETRTAKCVKKIESPYAIVLTGTPLENRLEELVSIVQFVDRYRLGPTYRFLHEHQVREEETGRVVGYRNLDEIGRTLEPILIRRQKDTVLDQLPERLEKNFFVPMTPQQRNYHEENREMVARVVHKWRRYGFLTEADQRRLMIGLQNMRMSCNSTYLLDKQTDHSVKPDELRTLLDELVEKPDTKAVIFSQWTRMHELTVRRVSEAGWEHVLFHGGVPSPKRKQLVEQFRNDDACRVFLATDAGGVGLNLQRANVVVNCDLPWNPAVLEQRIGRVHRIGQTQPVQVYNFVSESTIEEGMLSVLAFKKSLFAGVLDGGEKEVFLGGSRLKKFIETVEKVTGSIPAEQQPGRTVQDRGQGDGPASDDPSAAADEYPRKEARQPREDIRGYSSAAETAQPDPLAGLLQSGLALLEQLTVAARSPDSASREVTGGQQPAARFPDFLEAERDERTGQTYLKFRMPDPETLERTLAAVGTLLENVRR